LRWPVSAISRATLSVPGHPRKQKPNLAISLLIVRTRHVSRRAFRVLMKRSRNVPRTSPGRRPISVVSAATGHPSAGVIAMLKAQV